MAMTIKQQQCLLAYLGYYAGDLDGIWGPLSRAGTEAFQQTFGGIRIDGIVGEETEAALKRAVSEGMPRVPQAQEKLDFWQEMQYFSREEFRCKCGGKYCDGEPAQMQREVVEIAEHARIFFGRAGHVVSGLRCSQHNANCGGAAQSRHMCGKAVDLRIDGVTADTLLEFVQKQSGVRYAYKINATNVHFDVF